MDEGPDVEGVSGGGDVGLLKHGERGTEVVISHLFGLSSTAISGQTRSAYLAPCSSERVDVGS